MTVDPIYIYNYIITYSLELIAAIAGTIYYKKTKDKSIRIFVNYLWFIFCTEVFGLYAFFVYYYDFDRQAKKWTRHLIHEGGKVGLGIGLIALGPVHPAMGHRSQTQERQKFAPVCCR